MAVAFDAKATAVGESNSNVSPVTNANMTVGASATILLAFIGFTDITTAAVPTGVTWNGVAMTQIGIKTGSDGSSQTVSAVYALVNPATGNHTLSCSFTPGAGGNAGCYLDCASFSGSDTSSVAVAVPSASVQTLTQNPTGTVWPTASFTITTVSGDAIVATNCAGVNGTGGVSTGTQLNQDGTIDGNYISAYNLAVGATTSIQFNGCTANGGNINGVALRIVQPQSAVTSFGGRFSTFDRPAPLHNVARDFQSFVLPKQPTTLSQTGIGFFSPFDPPPPPHNYARQRDFQQFISPIPQIIENRFFGNIFPWWPNAPVPVNYAKQKDFQLFLSPVPQIIQNQFFGEGHDWWPQAPKPPYHAIDSIAFSGNTSVYSLVPLFYGGQFGNVWQVPPKPPQYAVLDWITQFGNISVDTLPIDPIKFSAFDPAPRPHNYACGWIEYSEFGYTTAVTAVTFGGFTPFDSAPAPRNLDVARRDFQTFINAPGNPNQFFGSGHDWWPNAPQPRNFAKDWIEFYQQTIVGPPSTWFPFTDFLPPAKPNNFAFKNFQEFINAPGNPNQFFGNIHDWWPRASKPPFYEIGWITQFGNISVDTLPIDPVPFSLFDPAPRPHNYSRDWIEYNEIGYTITTLSQTGIGFFTPFDPPAKPRNFALDWIVFSGNITVETPVAVSFGGFSPFDPAPLPRNLDITKRDFQEFINAPGNPNQFFGNSHDWWPTAPRPRNFAKDWIEFYDQTIVGPPSTWFPFTDFSLGLTAKNFAVKNFQEFINAPGNPNQFFGQGHDWWPRAPGAPPKNFAQDWITQFGNISVDTLPIDPIPFSTFDPAPRPHNYSRDWVEYNEIGYTITTLSQTGIGFFTPFDPPARPKNFAQDWIAFSGNISVESPAAIIFSGFSTFDPARAPRNLDVTRRDLQTFINAPGNPNQFFGAGHDWWPRAAKPPYYAIDWITQFGNISVDTLPINPIPFTPFAPAPPPHNFALDWVAYHPSNQFFTPTPTTSTMFTPFADGVKVKLWTRFGQQPQWWTYSFISPPSPPKPKAKRDTHDWIRKRHPPVYSPEYYASLLKLKELVEEIEQEEPEVAAAIIARVPNLLIPLDELIPPIDVATLKIDLPSLRTPVPEWTPEAADHVIEEILKSEIASEQHEVDIQKLVYESLLQRPPTPVKAPAVVSSRQAQNIVLQFANAIEKYHKAATSKKRVIYDSDGRVVGVEPIPDEDDPA